MKSQDKTKKKEEVENEEEEDELSFEANEEINKCTDD